MVFPVNDHLILYSAPPITTQKIPPFIASSVTVGLDMTALQYHFLH